jgi:deazaflavin-dependent oxidoreductase (nitroreductase family)
MEHKEATPAMKITRQKLERNLFRALNSVVEPAVRKGILSSKCAPSGLLLLETIGFKSGQKRSTPLLAAHVGDYSFVSTVRAKQSFWIRNLRKQPEVDYYRGGKLKRATALVLTSETDLSSFESLPQPLAAISKTLVGAKDSGFALAILRTTR